MSVSKDALWRAPACTARVKQLSLVPRESRIPFYLQQEKPRRWLSTATTETDPSLMRKGTSPSPFRRALFRRLIKKRSDFPPRRTELVRQLDKYPRKYESFRSLRKHRRSTATQHLYEQVQEAELDQTSDWRWTLEFLWRHTSKFGKILHFQAVIGKGAAAEAREILSMPDTHLWHIRQRNQSAIRIEDVGSQDGELVLSLSGSEDAVRKSFLEIVRAVGKLTAIRVLDPAWKGLLSEIWKGPRAKRPRVRLLGDRDAVVDDRVMTVRSESVSGRTWLSEPPKYRDYCLTQRADDIPVPKEWTKLSFERYVAALTCGQVPTHLAQSLYPDLPSHQEVVVSLLIDLFTSEDTRHAVSLPALGMALKYIQARGAGFRPAARELLHQVDQLNITIDAKTFNVFLVGCSKARDLNGFNSILRMMIRRGQPPESRAWIAFIEMIQDGNIKRYIARKMIAKGLDQNLTTLNAIGRQMAVANLERRLPAQFDIREYMDEQNKKYGARWINTITLNKLVDLLGTHGQLKACVDLLDLVHTSRTACPHTDTLNTILTHWRSLRQQITTVRWMETRWSTVVPDSSTYHLLFRTAWTKRLPNMIRVLWRYAALTNSMHPKMIYTLTGLLRQEENLSARRAFLKAWEDVIFGKAELAQMRALHGNALHITHLISEYTQQARHMRPSASFATKLQEAVDLDMEIHRLAREGAVMSSQVRASLSVDIPLEPEPQEPLSLSPKEQNLLVESHR
ncbi:hypothetical protein F4779DRAFT_626026 [Xylariaceae sp. FL0662B]|nr:hypothetical protein F4779DRAFT_626026 [Xylariaceae sp. FL0662B]